MMSKETGKHARGYMPMILWLILIVGNYKGARGSQMSTAVTLSQTSQRQLSDLLYQSCMIYKFRLIACCTSGARNMTRRNEDQDSNLLLSYISLRLISRHLT